MPMPPPPAWLPTFRLADPPAGFTDDPYPFYDALRLYSPVHPLDADSVLLTRHADVLTVYRSPHASSDKQREFAPRLGAGSPIYRHHTTSLVFNDPPLHTRVRRILMGALNQRAIARMETGVAECVERLLAAWSPGSEHDLIEDFAAGIPVDVIGGLLGVPRDAQGPLRRWSLDILSALEPAPAPGVLTQANDAVDRFTDFLRQLVADRRRHPGDPAHDVLTRLLQGDAEGALSEAELLHNCIFLLNAGHETTTNLIGNGVHALLTDRTQWQRLVAEPTLIPGAVEELLRHQSPLQLNNRLATAPIDLGHRQVAAGTFITLAIGAANRDGAAFDDPHRLDIGRKPNNHLAFGQGAHACSGMNVARLEARVALSHLAARFPDLALAGQPERDPRVRFRGFRRLPVRVPG